MRISDWSSDVCSSDLSAAGEAPDGEALGGVTIRPAELRDVPAIQAIYAHHVLHGTASFEEEPPEQAEIARRLAEVQQRGLPSLVAEDRPGRGAILGSAYAGPYPIGSAPGTDSGCPSV